MKYELVYTRRAASDIQKLDDHARSRIKKALETYCDSPYRYLEKLSNPDLGTYRFRFGNYRVVFDIEERTIVVLRVGHRREIYRGI